MHLSPLGRLALRLRRPSLAATFLVLVLILTGNRLLASPPPGTSQGFLLRITDILPPAIGVAGTIWFSPLPWQWNGRLRSLPSFRRGLLQSLLWSESWVALLAWSEIRVRQHLGLLVQSPRMLWFYYLSLFGGAMMLTGGLLSAREREEEERRRAQAEAFEAQALLLQSQLQPRLLINLLRDLKELIRTAPAQAEASVGTIADLLRMLPLASEELTWDLDLERSLGEAYLAVEAFRPGPRWNITWDWPENPSLRRVPPLLLLPLLENALQHGSVVLSEGGEIRIRLWEGRDGIHLAVSNTTTSAQPVGSQALQSLHARLDRLYHGFARLSMDAHGGRVEASLLIPTGSAEAHFASEAPESMRCSGAWADLKRRVRRPVLVMAFLTVMVFYVGTGFLIDPSPGDFRDPELWITWVISPGLQLIGLLWFSPIPWKGLAAGSRRPPLLRGLIQALVWSIGWGTAVVVIQTAASHRLGVPSAPFLQLWISRLSLFGAASFLVGGLLASREGEEEDKKIIQFEAFQAQTLLLQSQLQPHVLFNLLSGLAELIHRDPPQAQASVEAMLDLLWKLMKASEQRSCRLAEERALIEAYLGLEALRLGDRLKVVWDWPEVLNSRHVPPLLLQPLVENAIKHGIAIRPEGGEIRIEGRVDGQGHNLAVRNTGSRAHSNRGWGLGLRNLCARLERISGGKASFELRSENDWTTASIFLPHSLEPLS